MLIRIVRMTFRPEAVEAFRAIFQETSPRIRAFQGCEHLELWEDARFPNILSTYSLWHDREALDRYRESPLFSDAWNRARPLFAAPPVAHSAHLVSVVDSE